MSELTKLSNIGKELERQLNMIGIKTYDELVHCGSKETWLRIREIDASACINRLMALEGAIQNVRWHNLSQESKEELKSFYEESKKYIGGINNAKANN